MCPTHRAISRVLIAALLVLGLLPFAPTVRPAQADDPCLHVSGAFYFTSFGFTGPTTAEGIGFVAGDLVGGTHAEYFNIEQRGNGVTQLNGMHTIVTSKGTLFTYDESLILPERDPRFLRVNSRLYIIRGTGKYEGATGLLHTHGRVNAVTLEGSIDFKEQICLR